jgi:hypothetical protein
LDRAGAGGNGSAVLNLSARMFTCLSPLFLRVQKFITDYLSKDLSIIWKQQWCDSTVDAMEKA